MTAARRSFTFLGLALVAAVIFSPLVAAIAGTGINRTTIAAAFTAAHKPLVKSALVAGTAAGVAFVLGVPFALVVERAGRRMRRTLWAMALLTLMVPPYIVAESAIVLLGPAGKLSRSVALMLGIGPPASNPLARAQFTVKGFVYTWASAGCVLGGCLFSIVALAVAAAYRRTDGRIFEAALLARGRRGVLSIGARALMPLLVFAAALTESVVPQLLRVATIGEAIYERIQEDDLGTAAALGFLLLPIIILAGALGAFILVRTRAASLAGLEGDVPDFSPAASGRRRNMSAICVAIIALMPALALPAISLTWLAAAAKVPAATAGTHRVLRASGFLDAFRGAWDLAKDDAIRTAYLVTIAATIATIGATLLARPLARSKYGAILGVLGAGLAVPAPLVGLGLITLWNHGGVAGVVYESSAIVILCWLARFLPVAVLLAQAALARVPRELEEAAALAGRGAMSRLLSVVLPAAAPGLVAAWVATYVLSATEFAATLLIAPAGAPLLAPSVVNLMRRGQDPEIAACQVLLLLVVAAPVLVIAMGYAVRSCWKPEAK
jgi:iron(III) transport system permease protein